MTFFFHASLSLIETLYTSRYYRPFGMFKLVLFVFCLEAELAEATRRADQRAISARAVESDLEKLRPRVCRLVASLTGASAKVFGGAEDSDWGSGDPSGSGGGGVRWGRGSGLWGYGGNDGGGYGGGSGGGPSKDEPRTLSGVLRRLADGRMTHGMSAHLTEARHATVSASPSAAAAAARPCPYSLFMQDFAEDPFRGSRAPGISGASTKALARGRRAAGLAAAAAAAAAGSGAGASDLGQEGLRASLDELCNLHEELGAIGRMDPGSDSNIGRLMSIQMRRAETEARLEEHAAAMSDATHARESAAEAARIAVDATRDRTAGRRMRLEPYIPTKRRVVAAPAAAPSIEADEMEDGTDSSAPSPAGAAAGVTAAAAPATTSGGTTRTTRNPYSREGGNVYVPAPPRRRAPQLDEEGGGVATSRPGSSAAAAAAAVNAQWEIQPTNQYIPAARRRPQLHVPEPPHQTSIGASRSVRAAVVAVTASASGSSATSGPHSQTAAAPAPAAALFFPPSVTVRGAGGGAGQPPPMPSAAFQFGRTSSASTGLHPVFPTASDSSSTSSHRPNGTGVSVRRARTANRRGSRAEETERFLGGNPGDDSGDGPDGFFSALPPLPPPAPQYRGRGASTAGGPSQGGGSAPGNAATAAATAAAGVRGVAGAAGATGSSPDADPSSSSHRPPASEVAPELAELVELYCGRCQKAHARLRSAVSEREALSASTVAYLRRGRRGAAGRSFASSGVGGVGTSSVMTASVLSRSTARKGSTTWGGDGGQSGLRGTEKGHVCCAKCTEEVRVFCVRGAVDPYFRVPCPP